MSPPPRPTLLVVDDEPEVLRSVHDLFRREYRVLTFERGTDALEALEEVDPPVIMTDQRMPEMTGVEFLRRAKRIRPDATRLLFTGYADIKAVIDAINEGNVYRYLTKPWEPEEIATVVRQAVEQHDLIVERRRLIAELQASNARLLEADRLKRSFIEVASHELNTPVAVVLGMVDLWRLSKAETATPVERAWLDRIERAGRRLAGTVERMVKLLRADRFGATLDLRRVDLAALIRDVVEDLQPFLAARHLSVDVQIEPDLGAADLDPEKVADILRNLVINAIKFTPDGGAIRVGAGPIGPDWVQIRIEDSGIGIGPIEQSHLFEPFFTGFDAMHHSSGEYQFGKRGLGLGLCLVKTFVELHGGRVRVTTVPDSGSTFVVDLPRHPSAHEPAAEPLSA